MSSTAPKSRDAFRTISEVADWLETPAHVLRFWESKFAQVKPVKRAGGRRYYRPADMELLGGIKKLLHEEGMTIKGVQKLLREQGVRYVASLSTLTVDGSATGTLVDEAPFTDVASAETVVPFSRSSGQPDPAPLPDVAEEAAPEPTTAAAPQDSPADVGPQDEPPLPFDDWDKAQAAPSDDDDLIDAVTEELGPLLDPEPPIAEPPEGSTQDVALAEPEAPAPEVQDPVAEPEATPALDEAAPVLAAPDEATPDDAAPDDTALNDTTAIAEARPDAAPTEVVSDSDAQQEPAVPATADAAVQDTAVPAPETAIPESVAAPVVQAPPARPQRRPDPKIPLTSRLDPSTLDVDPGPLGHISRISQLTPEQARTLANHLATLRARAEKLGQSPSQDGR